MRTMIRTLLNAMAFVPATPFMAAFAVGRVLVGRDAALESTSQWISLWPGLSGDLVRRAFYRTTLAKCASTARISFGTLLSKCDAQFGEHVYIGPRCHLGCVTLEDDVLLGPAVQIPSGPLAHQFQRTDVPIRQQAGELRRVTIGRGSWLGSSAIVMADIGEESVVAAGAVVTARVPPWSIVAGVPARVVGSRRPARSEAPTCESSPPELAHAK